MLHKVLFFIAISLPLLAQEKPAELVPTGDCIDGHGTVIKNCIQGMQARIAWLEQKLAATEANSVRCFEALNGMFTAAQQQIVQINQKEPPRPEVKAPQTDAPKQP